MEENREEINARKRDFYRKNKARLSEVSKRYQLDNLDKFRSYNAKRRAAKNNALPVWFGEFDELVETEAASLAKLRQEATGLEWHVDHMIPLRAKLACGLHCWRNLQVIPRALNQKKKNRMLLTNPLEWITFL